MKSESWQNLNWNIKINILQYTLYTMTFKEPFSFYWLNMIARTTIYFLLCVIHWLGCFRYAFSLNLLEANIIIIIFLSNNIRKIRHKEILSLAQCHLAYRWPWQDSNGCLSTSWVGDLNYYAGPLSLPVLEQDHYMRSQKTLVMISVPLILSSWHF